MGILRDNKKKLRWRVLATSMAGIIVFVTTYSLILPAITIDTETAETMAGFDYALLDDEADTEDQEASLSVGQEPDETISDMSNAGISGEEGAGADFDSLFEDEEEAQDTGLAADAEEDSISYTDTEMTEVITGANETKDKIQVRVSYGQSAWIPDGTELDPIEIEENTELFARLEKGVQSVSDTDNSYDYHSRFFRLNLKNENEAVLPADTVTVELSFACPLYGDDFKVVQFDQMDESEFADDTSAVPYVPENVHFDRTGDGGVYRVTFDMDTISLFGLEIGYEKNEESPESETTETEAEAVSEAETEDITEAETEAETEDITEAETEAETEDITEAGTEMETETEFVYPAQSFNETTDTVIVNVYAPEGAFPEGTVMTVHDVDDSATLDAIESEAADEKTTISQIHAVDITFRTVNGEEIEPLIPIRVEMTPVEVPEADNAVVVHVDAQGNTETVETATENEQAGAAETLTAQSSGDEKASDTKTSTVDAGADIAAVGENTVAFNADSFSVYALVYTVDFEYEVDGKVYQYSMPGGEKITLSDLIEVLGIIDDTYSGEKPAFTTVDDFLKEVADVKFSDESLVKVTSVGGDWELESLQPFNTVESLNITMKNEDVVMVKVTDAVTGTIITDAPVSGKTYAIIVKKDGKYYSVFNDGTLRSIEGSYNPETNKIDVEMDYPLLWNYSSGNASWGPYNNLSIPSVASGFDPGNHLATGYYNRYINVKEPNGWKEENSSVNGVEVRENSAIWYDNTNHQLFGYDANGQRFIGVSDEDELHIIGNQEESNAAEIYLAETSVPNPSGGTHNDHMVNHIDIAIEGGSKIKIPLAYGAYQNAAGETIYTASENNHILEVTPTIPLEIEDMKRADITASAIVDGERKELDNVFYVTGYSQNDKSGNPNAKDQIRIEGSFKVSNIPYFENADNDPEVRDARKANPIDYTITITKTVPVTVQYDEQDLYADGKKLVFNIPISLSASFNYWQIGNKCPAVHLGLNENGPYDSNWLAGKILNEGIFMSGMDFDLAAAASGGSNNLAIEINKVVQKEDGSYITTTASHEVGVEVYYKEKSAGEEDDLINIGVNGAVDGSTLSTLTNGYTKLHNKHLPVGTSGIGAIYDYDVQPGLLYVKEDPDKVEEYLTGTDNKLYQYVSTRMETEYNWRADGDENKLHHANGTTSVPAVLGDYSFNGENHSNGFLPFYIYNVYKEVETVDVPVDKSWPDLDNDSSYTWTTTFDLEELEVHVSGLERSEANTTHWRKVEDAGSITISNGDSEEDRTFSNLPKYRYYKNEDGTESVYRIIYSVDEIAYELKQNGNTINKWDKDHGLSVGDFYYRPEFPHDAGDANDESGILETDPRFYHVIVENHKSQVYVREELTNLSIQKTWEEGALEQAGISKENASAKFQLMRYVTNTYHDYDSCYDGSDCVVRLYNKDDELVQSMTVKKGAKMKVVATSSNNGEIHYTVNSQDYSLRWDNGSGTTNSGDFVIRGDTDIKRTRGQYYTPPWTAEITESHLEYYASQGSQVKLDTDFENEKHYYVLKNENDWHETISSLPLIEEGAIRSNTQTISSYSYFFKEIESYPAGFYAEFTDGNGNPLGDLDHRISDSDTIVHAENKPIPPFVVEKIWRGVPKADGFPSVFFDLYKKGTNNQPDEKVYEHIELKSTPDNPETDFRWVCPDLLEEGAQYYAIETTKTGQVDDLSWTLYGYSAFDGTDESQATLRVGVTMADDDAKKAYVQGNTGTIRIQNKLNKYIEFDIDKKWVELRPEGTGGSWYTTTQENYMKKDLVFGFKVIRRIRRKIDGSYGTFASYTDQMANNEKYQKDQQYIIQNWTEIGNELLAGYDSDGNAVFNNNINNFWLKNAGGDWHFQIHDNSGNFGSNFEGGDNVGLPAYGLWYNESTEQYEVVLYEYSVREVGVYANLNKDPYVLSDWFMSVTPPYSKDGNGTEHEPFPRMPLQDQNRIINYQASNLRVRKNWYGSGKTDVEEIYLKIYRTEGEGEWEDFTETIVNDKVNNHNWQNYVDAENIDEKNGWLILRPDGKDNELIIHRLLICEAGADGKAPYRYAVQEVGYKRNGVVYTDSSDLQLLEPRYDREIGTYIEGIGTMVDYSKIDEYLAAATEGQMEPSGQTTINIGNNPLIDLTVHKTWLDSNGNPMQPEPGTEVSFKIKQVRENQTTHSQEESYISIDGETIFRLKKSGQKVLVKEDVPAYSDPGHLYPASENPSAYLMKSNEKSDADWTYYLDGLIGGYVDANKQEWSCKYYIEEVGVNGFDVSMKGNDGITVGGHTVEITNRKNDHGALNIIKEVEEGSPADTTDAFTYQVVLTPDSNTTIDVSKISFNGKGAISNVTFSSKNPGPGESVTITVTMAGTGRLTINNIPKNTTYEVTEPSNNMPAGWSQVGEVEYSDSTKTINQEEYTDEATVTNKQTKVNISVTKEWVNADGTHTAPRGASVKFDLYRNETLVDHSTITLDGEPDENGETAAWMAKWSALDKYDDNEHPYTYTVKEQGSGWEHYVVSYPVGDSNQQKTFASDGETITNTETTTDLTVDKKWFASEIDAAANEETVPTITTIYYKIMQKAGTGEATQYPNSTTVYNLTYTPGQNDQPGDWTQATHTGLPKKVYMSNAQTSADSAWVEATYYVVECNSDGTDLSGVNYDVTYQKNEGTAGSAATSAAVSGSDPQHTITIINTNSTIDLAIEKYNDKDEKLDGARFQLTRKNANNTYEKFENDAFSQEDDKGKVGAFEVKDGTITISGLIAGDYLLSEVNAPEGYVITDSSAIYFTISDGKITYTDENGTAVENQKTRLIEFVQADNKIKIKNTPGAALPSTGGPGTQPFTIPGTLMVLGAGTLLSRRRRRERNKCNQDNKE